MVYTAKSDIVCPSVTTEYPLRFLSQEVFVLHNILANRAVDSFQSCNQFLSSSSVGSAYACLLYTSAAENAAPVKTKSRQILFCSTGSAPEQLRILPVDHHRFPFIDPAHQHRRKAGIQKAL